MAKITEADKAKFLEMMHFTYPKGGVYFAETPGGLSYVIISIKTEHKDGTVSEKHETTMDRFILSHLLPELLKTLCELENIPLTKIRQKWLECVNEVFEEAAFDAAPRTIIEYTYEAVFDELVRHKSKTETAEEKSKFIEELESLTPTPKTEIVPVGPPPSLPKHYIPDMPV